MTVEGSSGRISGDVERRTRPPYRVVAATISSFDHAPASRSTRPARRLRWSGLHRHRRTRQWHDSQATMATADDVSGS